ncbi:hypothetical protein GN244_ATG05568 [Phytophthora infestans]|uniref:Uncharacterized protein n=1 Tax=Phytophthora infestans TaxID=4787 RepID=A0A833W4P9_PHYIN|nr:hypothetical protein GN244_ATG05568 [Phytophthora infestans]
MTRSKSAISPLSYASYGLERDGSTAVLSYCDSFRGFDQEILRLGELAKCVENGWSQCKKRLFMLGYALHSEYANDTRTLTNTVISGVDSLPELAVYIIGGCLTLTMSERLATIIQKRNQANLMDHRGNIGSISLRKAQNVCYQHLHSDHSLLRPTRTSASTETQYTHSEKKLSCRDERVIIRDALTGMFTFLQQPIQGRSAESLAEVFEDEEFDAAYEEKMETVHQQHEKDADKFDYLASPVLHEFPNATIQHFPEKKKQRKRERTQES